MERLKSLSNKALAEYLLNINRNIIKSQCMINNLWKHHAGSMDEIFKACLYLTAQQAMELQCKPTPNIKSVRTKCTNKPRFHALRGDTTSTLSEINSAKLDRNKTALIVTDTISRSVKGAAIFVARKNPSTRCTLGNVVRCHFLPTHFNVIEVRVGLQCEEALKTFMI